MTEVFVCQSKDDGLLRSSASGGAFTHLAELILSQGGAVFGAAWRDGRCVHLCARTPDELAPLRGSKYMRSDTGDTYRQAEALLKEGVPVLYSGTPCQIAGLKAFLKQEYPGLAAVDLICHGVPEQKVWEAYAARFPQAPEAVGFRDKTEGWRNFSIRLAFPDGSVYRKVHSKDPYMRAFLSNLSLRKACLSCKCNTTEKKADITLGDDWGGELKDCGDKGTSVVLTHTQKGAGLFAAAALRMRVEQTTFERAAAANPVLLSPAKPHPRRDDFLAQVSPDNFDILVNRWDKPDIVHRVKRIVKRLLRR